MTMKFINRIKNATLIFILLPILSLASSRALACATAGKSAKSSSQKSNWKKYWSSCKTTNPQKGRKPSAALGLPTADQGPWGGPDSSRWQPEAILANAVSEALNDGWAQTNVNDVLISVPLQLKFSALRPYGDGQTNASIALGDSWYRTEPILIATLTKFNDGSSKIKLRLHRSLNLAAQNASLAYTKSGSQALLKFNKSQKSKAGDSDFELVLNRGEGPAWGDLFESHVAFAQVEGFKDWFPIDFRDVVKNADDMLSQISPEMRNLGRGNLLDPENVSARNKSADYFPFLGMADPNFGQDVHADRYFPVPGSGIHNEFPYATGENRITAVGHGNTLVMIKAPAPFKLAYICFDRRNQTEEAKFGVPSGGGWHEIGDPAETVFNSLENEAALFGYANSRPASAPPSNLFAYGLTDIAVFRMLKPGSALITAAGATTASEDASGWQNRGQQSLPGGRNFHWFAFHQPHEICALEWVHPHIPTCTNHLGMDR